MFPQHCKTCDQPISDRRWGTSYCSNACRQAAYRNRFKAAHATKAEATQARKRAKCYTATTAQRKQERAVNRTLAQVIAEDHADAKADARRRAAQTRQDEVAVKRALDKIIADDEAKEARLTAALPAMAKPKARRPAKKAR